MVGARGGDGEDKVVYHGTHPRPDWMVGQASGCVPPECTTLASISWLIGECCKLLDTLFFPEPLSHGPFPIITSWIQREMRMSLLSSRDFMYASVPSYTNPSTP